MSCFVLPRKGLLWRTPIHAAAACEDAQRRERGGVRRRGCHQWHWQQQCHGLGRLAMSFQYAVTAGHSTVSYSSSS